VSFPLCHCLFCSSNNGLDVSPAERSPEGREHQVNPLVLTCPSSCSAPYVLARSRPAGMDRDRDGAIASEDFDLFGSSWGRSLSLSVLTGSHTGKQELRYGGKRLREKILFRLMCVSL
jgi:hypothetical protein